MRQLGFLRRAAVGGTGADLRSKTRILNKVPTKPEDLPAWNYDGSSTGQVRLSTQLRPRQRQSSPRRCTWHRAIPAEHRRPASACTTHAAPLM